LSRFLFLVRNKEVFLMTTSMLTLCAGLALMADPKAAPETQATQPAAAEQAKAQTVNKPVVQPASYFPIEVAVATQTNAERARYGLPPLELDPSLVQTARKHTWWMTRNRWLQHGNYPVAENIAMGQNSSQEVVRCWMNSSGHRANILNRGHRRIGVAAYTTPSGTTYWCQQFSR
jgi:uncharacterized protein YkwD